MKLATFTNGGRTRIGVVEGDVVDLSAAEPNLPTEMTAFLAAGDAALEAARSAVAASRSLLPLGEVKLEAPVLRPPEFLAIGLNYADHIAEAGLGTPEFPLFFNKQTSCVTGPNDPGRRGHAGGSR